MCVEMRVCTLCFVHSGTQNAEADLSLLAPVENVEHHQSLVKYNQKGSAVFLVKYGRAISRKQVPSHSIEENILLPHPRDLQKLLVDRKYIKELEKRLALAVPPAGSFWDEPQRSGTPFQDHNFEPIPSAPCHLCLQRRNGNPLPSCRAEGDSYLPPPTPLSPPPV